jgi:hypothetical protein
MINHTYYTLLCTYIISLMGCNKPDFYMNKIWNYFDSFVPVKISTFTKNLKSDNATLNNVIRDLKLFDVDKDQW